MIPFNNEHELFPEIFRYPQGNYYRQDNEDPNYYTGTSSWVMRDMKIRCKIKLIEELVQHAENKNIQTNAQEDQAQPSPGKPCFPDTY